jgi:hypothetical protein
MEITGVDEDIYSQYLFGQGQKFIYQYLEGTEAFASSVLKTTEYWHWFANQWDLRERQFLHEYGSYLHLCEKTFFYLEWINVHKIMKMNHLRVWEKAMDAAAQLLIKSTIK